MSADPQVLRQRAAGSRVPPVGSGWAELLRWVRLRVQREERDPAATWSRFQKLAARSERAEILKHVVRVGRLLPDLERYRLAVSITRMLAPIEWPSEWSEARLRLVSALDTLVEETDPDAASSFFGLHDLGPDAVLQRVGHRVVQNSRDLLQRPCRRDELAVVARLCNAGNAACLLAYRRAVKRSAALVTDDQAARAHYRSAFEAYAEAAGALNEVVGAVLFEGLDASIP